LEPGVPVLIAEGRQYFARNGLDVTIKNYDTGLNAVNAMLKDEMDISSPVADYVLAGKALQHEDIQTIGCLDKVDYAFIVGRKDRGIKTISDLKGKRIGVMRGTMTEFYLGRFLELRGIKMENITLVNIAKNTQAFDEITGGDVDAVISVQPVVNAAQNQLGRNAVVWPAQSNQPFYALLTCKKEWIRQHPKLIERFLRAINQAEEYIVQHPDKAKAIVKKRLGFTDDYVDRVWSRNIFFLSLDQSLVAAMEDEARWMIKSHLTKEKQVPDFTDYIHVHALKAIKPEAVNIIR
jgi:NitT/TauT family transport system substrate-binding protein